MENFIHFWDSTPDAEADPKEITGEVERSECPDDAKLSSDKNLSVESKGEPEPAIDSVPVLFTVLNSSVETAQCQS